MQLGKIAQYAYRLKELVDRLEKAKPKKQSPIEEYKEKLIDTTDMLHEMRIDSDEDDQC